MTNGFLYHFERRVPHSLYEEAESWKLSNFFRLKKLF